MKRMLLFVFLILCGCGNNTEGKNAGSGNDNAGIFYTDGDKSKKWVALTFDDGPNPAVSAEIVDVLKNKNVKASFFVLGAKAEIHPQYIKMFIDNGHEIGNHTYSHKNFYQLKKIRNSEGLKSIVASELAENDGIIKKIISKKPLFIRMPYGFISSEVKKVAAENGYIIVNWTFGCDWQPMTKEKLIKNYIAHIKPGAILLFHEKKLTASALPEIIDEIKGKGYEIVPLRQILARKEPPR